MTDTAATQENLIKEALPEERSIYLGLSRKFNLIRSAIFIIAMGLIAYSLSGDPSTQVIFITLIVLAAICYEIGLSIHNRNKNTVLFRPAENELVINDKTYRYQQATLTLAEKMSPLMWVVVDENKHMLSLLPGWNPSHSSIRTWTPLDVLVLTDFVKKVGTTEQHQLFQKDWLPLAQRKMKIGHVPLEKVTDASDGPDLDQTP